MITEHHGEPCHAFGDMGYSWPLIIKRREAECSVCVVLIFI